MAKIPKTAKKPGFGDPRETGRGGFYINPSRRGPAVPAGTGSWDPDATKRRVSPGRPGPRG